MEVNNIMLVKIQSHFGVNGVLKLIRRNLGYEQSVTYFIDQLNCSYELSKELKNTLNFKSGQFFTLLPEEADLSRMYEFFGGLILPQNPTHVIVNKFGKSSSYTWIPTLTEEISNYIYNLMQIKHNYVCIFEDVKNRLGDPHLDFFFRYGLLYSNQIYYLLNKSNASPEVIATAMGESDALWHFLFILTECDKPDNIGKEINLENIKEFAKNTQLLVLGAYDGEGFVFWEPKSNQ